LLNRLSFTFGFADSGFFGGFGLQDACGFFRIAEAFCPSATRITDCFSPSALRIDSRLSRSALICFSIAS
jgi:hypothetical protein